MDKYEAKAILRSELQKYRQRNFESLLKLLKDPDAYTIQGPSGLEYQIEVQAIWDNEPEGNLRVMAGIDDGGFFSAFIPLTDDFIISPNGEFLNEL
jgi:hypothetical protein